ncbi:type II toxin-antitoxin system RelE family toxin [Mycobacterium talmoniae]|uniref:Toxin RelE n=1 Tax=Mycobacterium talmoniae TaxID=1858794 RepID=A0A2S8BCG6_9MYCO|nr:MULTISPECIES: type II toxin-antitoxin system RelE/ParE family toxin [Mycobacterium]PQM44335.1 Toxin RelE [Mycobacterium talmoniae]
MTPPAGRYRIEVDASAQRDLARLPPKIATAIVEFVTGALADNPHRLSKPLRAELASYRSARRGDYRVLVRIDDDHHVVLVVAITHRAHVYRPR